MAFASIVPSAGQSHSASVFRGWNEGFDKDHFSSQSSCGHDDRRQLPACNASAAPPAHPGPPADRILGKSNSCLAETSLSSLGTD